MIGITLPLPDRTDKEWAVLCAQAYRSFSFLPKRPLHAYVVAYKTVLADMGCKPQFTTEDVEKYLTLVD